jgi:hypothetical protein
MTSTSSAKGTVLATRVLPEEMEPQGDAGVLPGADVSAWYPESSLGRRE